MKMKNVFNWMWVCVSGVLLIAMLALIPFYGCAITPPAAFPREFAQATGAAAASMMDQAVWDTVMARLHGHVNNPGMRTAVGMEWFAEFKIINADGDILLEGDGKGSGTLSPEARKVILELLDETTNSEVKVVLEKILDKFKVESATTQPVEAKPKLPPVQ